MQDRLLLCSYNILADEYINYQRSAGIPEQWLQHQHRLSLIVNKLTNIKWSIICLQEVETKVIPILNEHCSEYTMYYAQRPQGKQDGLAMLIHKDVQCTSQGTLALPSVDGKIGSRILQYAEVLWGDQTLTIVNLHISWNAPDQNPPAGTTEIKSVINWLRERKKTDFILCGDWNAERSEEVVELLCTGIAQPVQFLLPPTALTCWVSGRFLGIDHVLISEGVSAKCIELVNASKMKYCPNQSEGSDHLLVGVEICHNIE